MRHRLARAHRPQRRAVLWRRASTREVPPKLPVSAGYARFPRSIDQARTSRERGAERRSGSRAHACLRAPPPCRRREKRGAKPAKKNKPPVDATAGPAVRALSEKTNQAWWFVLPALLQPARRQGTNAGLLAAGASVLDAGFHPFCGSLKLTRSGAQIRRVAAGKSL